MSEWIIVIGMLAVTFLPRYLPLALVNHVNLPDWLMSALHYIPIAALTVIVVQNSFFLEQQLQLSLDNERLITVAVAVVVAMLTKKLSWVVGVGLVVYFTLLTIM